MNRVFIGILIVLLTSFSRQPIKANDDEEKIINAFGMQIPVYDPGNNARIDLYNYYPDDFLESSIEYGNKNPGEKTIISMIKFYTDFFQKNGIDYKFNVKGCEGRVHIFDSQYFFIRLQTNDALPCSRIEWNSARKKYYEKIYIKDMPFKDIYSEKGNEIYRLINEKIEYDKMKMVSSNSPRITYLKGYPFRVFIGIEKKDGKSKLYTYSGDKAFDVLRTNKNAIVSKNSGVDIYRYPTTLSEKGTHLNYKSSLFVNHFVRDDHYNKRWVKIGEGQFIMEDGIRYENQKEIDAADREYKENLRKRDQK